MATKIININQINVLFGEFFILIITALSFKNLIYSLFLLEKVLI